MVHHFEKVYLPQNVHFRRQLRRVSQQARKQQPSLPIDFDLLPVITGPQQNLSLALVRRILWLHGRKLLFFLRPDAQRIYSGAQSVYARDIKLSAAVFLQNLEKWSGDLETTLLVDLRRTVAPQLH